MQSIILVSLILNVFYTVKRINYKKGQIMNYTTAIIIGASTGIGAATAVRLSEIYKNIAITSFHHQNELARVRDEITAKGASCYMECGDAGNYNFIKSFINNTVAHFGGDISLLINNAGISYIGLLTDTDISDWEHVMNTNATSVFNSCHEVVPYMVHNKSGKIINVSSVWGSVGASCETAYSASKGAVNAFTKALAKELAPSHISVNAIAFGAIDTSMNSHLSPEEKTALEDEIPFGRMGTADEAADFVMSVALSNEYLTGQILTFDGGWQ